MRHLMAALMVAAIPASAEAARITPHRAIYDLKLDSSDDSASLASVDGRLAFEVADAGCEGWTVNFRMANRYKPLEGNVRLVDTQSTSYETLDGNKLDYSEKTFVNQSLETETRLRVARDSADGPGEGTMSLPKSKEFQLAAGVVFPMQHQLKIMRLAEEGTTRDTSMVFDGSDNENVFRAITFIGKMRAPGMSGVDTSNKEAAALADLRSWPVTVSYYETSGDNQDTPSYQIAFNLFENGVAAGLNLDYGSFKMRGEISRLEFLPVEDCD